MNSDRIEIKNIRGIKELNYSLPTSKGVYLLTGSNGSGKTSLLTVLDRLGNKNAFKIGLKDVNRRDASITYIIQEEKVVYKKNRERWTPTPKRLSQLLNRYMYSKTYFLTATGLRFHETQTDDNGQRSQDVRQEMRDALNKILGTKKFNNLKYRVVSSMRGRQSQLRRDNKLYIIEETSRSCYTEKSFSLGERMVLNALDFLETVEEGGMLLIDEVELALHPKAQIEFYKVLKEKANEKNLVIIISTHSSTLIKVADQIYYLENKDGKISVINNVKPAYILKDLSVEPDLCPDYLFFVEDEMARAYLSKILDFFQKMERDLDRITFKILPVGGYSQVLNLMTYFYGVQPFTKKTVHSFLDKDVENICRELEVKRKRTPSEDEFLHLIRDNKDNYHYLPIIPELGIWNELTENSIWFQKSLNDKFHDILFDVGQLISTIAEDSKDNNNPSKRAKDCLKNLFYRVHEKKAEITESIFFSTLMESYVEHKFDSDTFKNEIRHLLLPILNK